MKATGRPGKKKDPPKRAAPRSASAPAQAEERLLVEAAQSDPARFDALYELHFERVYGFIAARVHDRATAEDLSSDVFYKALANLKSYEWRGVPFLAWLLRIAANAIIDRSQRASREHPMMDDPPDLGVKPNMRVIENRARLFQLVKQLPKTQRRVVQERFVDQRSIREIAERLGKSEGAIKQLQLRARAPSSADGGRPCLSDCPSAPSLSNSKKLFKASSSPCSRGRSRRLIATSRGWRPSRANCASCPEKSSGQHSNPNCKGEPPCP